MLDQDVATALCAVTAVADVAAFKSAKEHFPFVTFTFSFFHNVNALTGAAE
jgi:hypothetical protein